MTFIIGALATLILFYLQGHSVPQLMNGHSAFLVLGGTVCVALLMTPWQSLRQLLQLFTHSSKDENAMTSLEFDAFLRNPNQQMSDPYGLFAQARDLWELNVSDDDFERTLTQQAESVLNRNLAVINVLRNFGKYPPALGMVGTVVGMIQLFAGLQGNQEQTQIGAQLAVAMTATLYGLVLSNFIFLPLADRLETREEERRANLEKTVKLLISVQRRQPASVTKRVVYAA